MYTIEKGYGVELGSDGSVAPDLVYESPEAPATPNAEPGYFKLPFILRRLGGVATVDELPTAKDNKQDRNTGDKNTNPEVSEEQKKAAKEADTKKSR
jgi:hypothetical protein